MHGNKCFFALKNVLEAFKAQLFRIPEVHLNLREAYD